MNRLVLTINGEKKFFPWTDLYDEKTRSELMKNMAKFWRVPISAVTIEFKAGEKCRS